MDRLLPSAGSARRRELRPAAVLRFFGEAVDGHLPPDPQLGPLAPVGGPGCAGEGRAKAAVSPAAAKSGATENGFLLLQENGAPSWHVVAVRLCWPQSGWAVVCWCNMPGSMPGGEEWK